LEIGSGFKKNDESVDPIFHLSIYHPLYVVGNYSDKEISNMVEL